MSTPLDASSALLGGLSSGADGSSDVAAAVAAWNTTAAYTLATSSVADEWKTRMLRAGRVVAEEGRMARGPAGVVVSLVHTHAAQKRECTKLSVSGTFCVHAHSLTCFDSACSKSIASWRFMMLDGAIQARTRASECHDRNERDHDLHRLHDVEACRGMSR